jgi:hypothetical protein
VAMSFFPKSSAARLVPRLSLVFSVNFSARVRKPDSTR